MKYQNDTTITTRVAGTKFYTFNIPDLNDRVILLHNPFNKKDNNAIMVLNQQLQQIGHLTSLGEFNKKVGNLIDWKPYVGRVTGIYPEFNELFIEIDLLPLQKNLLTINRIFRCAPNKN